jgi:hypothetical protein
LRGVQKRLGTPPIRETRPVSLQVYRPDGQVVDASGVFDGDPGFAIPVSARYTFVLSNDTTSDAQVTIWSAADAPAAAHQPPDVSSDHCVTQVSIETCSSAETTTATTVPHG